MNFEAKNFDGKPQDDGIPDHLTVSMVLRDIKKALMQGLPRSIWVKGEVSSFREGSNGHRYFDLLERIQNGTQVLLPCSSWSSNWPKLLAKLQENGIDINNGQEMMFQGTIKLMDRTGKLCFDVTNANPEFSLGTIEKRRQSVLKRLEQEQLIERNKSLEIPHVPLRIAVLSSRTAAGFEDFRNVLMNSCYGFQVFFFDVPVQGPQVEESVCDALKYLVQKQPRFQIDAVCIVRGGGSASDLDCWNSYPICAAVARMPVPVITGIGHDRDHVAIDEVAHTKVTTPTAAAKLLCERVQNADLNIHETSSQIQQLVDQRIGGITQAVESVRKDIIHSSKTLIANALNQVQLLRNQCTANARIVLVRHDGCLRGFQEELVQGSARGIRELSKFVAEMQSAMKNSARQIGKQAIKDLEWMAREVALIAQNRHEDLDSECQNLATIVTELALQLITKHCTHLDHMTEMVESIDPDNILRRGFSITMNTDRKVVKSNADLAHGETMITWLASGKIASTITQIF